MYDVQYAEAAPIEVWSANLTVRSADNFGTAILGCHNSFSGIGCAGALTDDDFTYDGTTYTIHSIVTVNNILTFSVAPDELPADIGNHGTLHIDGETFEFAGYDSGMAEHWHNIEHFTANDTLQVRLTVLLPPPQSQVWVGDVWSGSLIVQNHHNLYGCHDSFPGAHCNNYLILNDNDFTYEGISYQIWGIKYTPASGELRLSFSQPLHEDLLYGTFTANATTLRMADGQVANAGQTVFWSHSGVGWMPDDLAQMTLNAGQPPPPTSEDVRPSSNTIPPPRPTTSGSGSSGSGSSGSGSSGSGSSGSGSFFFIPVVRDTTPPTITMIDVENDTKMLGETLTFNITFSEPVSGIDASSFVLMSGNQTIPITNHTSINATIHPEQVVPHGSMADFNMEVEADGIVNEGVVWFDTEYLKSSFLKVWLTSPDCRTFLLHNQTFPLPSDMIKPRTLEMTGSPAAGTWMFSVQNNARTQNATVHSFGLTLDVGQTIIVDGTGSDRMITVNAATTGNLTLGLVDDHNIVDAAGNRLAGEIPTNSYTVIESPKQTCP